MQLKVIKKDGKIESYIQTKVMKTLCCCLSILEDNISIAESLTEAFTFHLYKKNDSVITTSEIHSMLKVILFETGFDAAAVKLHQHHYNRLLKRNCVKVIDADISSVEDAQTFCQIKELGHYSEWDKSEILNWLENKHQLDITNARAMASEVEEKILSLNLGFVSTDLIKHFALIQAANFINRQQEELSQKKVRNKKRIEIMPEAVFDLEYTKEKEAVLI